MPRPSRKVKNPEQRHRYPGEIIDLTGKRYGRLVGVRFAGRADDYGRSMWVYRVRSGDTHSCGCLRKRMESPPVPAPIEFIDEHW